MKKKIRKVVQTPEFKIDDYLLKNRRLFLFGPVEAETVSILIKQLISLDSVSADPIYLHIDSPGGSVHDGFALIDTIGQIEAPVYTVIFGHACSMAGAISISGKVRLITKNSFWMAHDMSGGVHGDYSGKVEYRAAYIKRLWTMLETHLKTHTKLTPKELVEMRSGELWLTPEECLEKGVVDKII